MNHLLKRGLALVCMLALLLCLIPVSASAADVGEFTILSTTDMHGRCWDVNLLTGGNVSNTMLNVSSAVASIRSSKSNVILIDNGDLYQGTPVSGYHLTQLKAGETTDPNPMALCLAEIKYDYAVIGNHEFNYSWDVMETTRSYLTQNGVSTLCANLYYDGTDGAHAAGTNVFTPYLFKQITVGGKTYKIAIIGFENTDCPRWDVSDNYPGIVFTHPDNVHNSIAWEADKYIKEVKAKGADAIIIAYHSGLGAAVAPDDIVFGSNSENQVLSMIANNTDIDLVIAGHDHSSSYSGNTYKDKNGNDVLVVNGGGSNLTCTTFGINENGIYVKENRDIALSSYSPDAALKEKIRPYAEAAEVNVNRSVGKLVGTWNTVSNYYLAQSDAMDLINRAQIDRGNYYLTQKYRTADEVNTLLAKTGLDHLTVDFSATSMVVSGNYKVSAGEMSMKDIYKLYKYDNTLYLVPLTGQQIKDIMEFVASERLSVNTMSGSPVYGTKGDDFTNPIFYGLDFVYDMSQPAGNRVVISKFADGRAFELTKTYIMAINNYHLGNGPFAALSTADAIWSQVDDSVGSVPDLIGEFITAETAAKGGVSPAPSSWSLVYTGEIGGGGTATGAYIGTLVDDPSTLSDGDQIMIFHVAGGQLVSSVASGSKLAPSGDVNSGDKQIGTNDATAIFRVKKGSDGKFRFLDADGKFMTYGQTGNSLAMSGTETDYAQWEFEAVSGGIVHLHCVNAAYNGNYNQYLEFYGGAFTTYGIGGGGGAYEYMIFRLNGSTPQPTEPTTAPTEPTTAPTTPTEPVGDGSFVLSSAIKGGDQVVIYNPGHGMAIKDETDNNWYLVPQAITPTNNKIYD
ncbi:MAG: 5'-nucleotidase C-terminal domain-containing protein, partial [Oscillospiraceae bacterium]|nr:5'-nucleotidase C-terminal domain-containing protein [Oscillospiraceae bacterium]